MSNIFFRAQVALALLVVFVVNPALAQSATLLLWPIQQVIEADRSGSALWIENRGKHEANVQIRVFSWDQSEYADTYSAQQQVVASPQFATVAPGNRQLVRLMRMSPVAAGQERAFRVIIDDIPRNDAESSSADSVGLKFQMRYSLPLFLDGAGVWTKPDPQRTRAPESATQPVLTWHVASEGDKRYLHVKNAGAVHARLAKVQWLAKDGSSKELSAGLLGYVLAGRQMRWPLKDLAVDQNMTLQVQLADNGPLVDVAHQ